MSDPHVLPLLYCRSWNLPRLLPFATACCTLQVNVLTAGRMARWDQRPVGMHPTAELLPPVVRYHHPGVISHPLELCQFHLWYSVAWGWNPRVRWHNLILFHRGPHPRSGRPIPLQRPGGSHKGRLQIAETLRCRLHSKGRHFLENFANFASMCGSKDNPPYFEGGELKKTCFGRYFGG